MSVFRRSWPTERLIKPGLRTRIIIPQRPERTYQISAGDAVRPDVLRKDPYWFTLHRKGLHRPQIGVDPLEERAVSRS